jgi:hypothetical protein
MVNFLEVDSYKRKDKTALDTSRDKFPKGAGGHWLLSPGGTRPRGTPPIKDAAAPKCVRLP